MEQISHSDYQERIDYIRFEAIKNEKMRNWTFEKDDGGDERMRRIAMNYVLNFDEMKRRGKGLLLFGGCGSGKSFYAACIVNALVEKLHDCTITNFSRIGNDLQNQFTERQKCLESLNKYELLVIDDFLSERKTDFMKEIVYNVIDNRYFSGLPLIVTTNATANDMKYCADSSYKRIYSRLFEMCIPIEVKRPDRRREVLKKDYEELKGLLGL